MSVRQLFDLTGRVALITGGSRGLGLQIGEALGEMGAKIAISARKQPELDAAAAHLERQGVEVMTAACDLQDPKAAKPLVEEVLAKFERLDVLVNNAGTTWGAPAEEHPLEAWNKVINLNLTAVFALSQTAANLAMIPARYGRIVNIASIAGLSGTHIDVMCTIAYNTSKGGVVNFTRSLAAEWARYNITVNAIAPGFFPSKMAKVMIETHKDAIMQFTPLRRLGGAEDLKGVAVLLASDASGFITGQTIAVDGGVSAI
ncbi:MAG: gluconate 5-dehydrogenase [Betaproteobacteria bacterium RIFCSPLOWO2_12_FULL_68_20]|nr:MAG: gluconate 5-dehydrogenase [Betaproteobacteria bacterium RIFCSPLOWO2_12_FULL_68_20]